MFSLTRTYRIVAILVLLALGLIPPKAQAQTDYWQKAPGPFGGTNVADLLRLSDSEILAASSNGIFKSTDGGVSWSSYSTGLSNFDVRALIELADGRIIAATYGSGLASLNRQTQTWSPAGLERTYTTSIMEPVAGHILVGAQQFVYDSLDNGATWKSRSMEGFQVNVQDVAFNATHLFAATSLGMFRSADHGKTWEFASFGLDEYNILTVHTDPQGVVYAGAAAAAGGCSLYRSRGNGSIWSCIQPQADPLLVSAIKNDPNGTLWVGGHQRVFTSQDEGSTWITYSASTSSVQAFSFSSGNTSLLGTAGLGVWRSENAGITWVESNLGLQSKIRSISQKGIGNVLVGTDGGLFESKDFGNTWARIETGSPLLYGILDIELDNQQRVVVGTSAGVWRHTLGTGWEALGPPGMPSIRDVTITNDQTIVAAYHSGLYSLKNSTWTPTAIVGSDQATRDVSAVTVTGSGTILVGAAWDSWKKTIGSNEWEIMHAGSVPWFDIQSFGKKENRILAGTKFLGVLETTDEGESWVTLNAGLNGNEDVRAIAFDFGGRAHIATYGSGIFQMNPWTKAWLPMNRGLENHLRVTSLAFDTNGNAYAGTIDGGLFRHIINTSTGVHVESDQPQRFELGTVYPNPTQATLHIPVHQPSPETISVRVYDMLGRMVVQMEHFQTQSYSEYQLDVRDWPAGSYLFNVRSGSQFQNGSFVVIR